MIQIPQRCKWFTKNDNLNRTCQDKHRCKIYYDEICKEYMEDERNDTNNNLNNASLER